MLIKKVNERNRRDKNAFPRIGYDTELWIIHILQMLYMKLE
jgi:hypothetical protein